MPAGGGALPKANYKAAFSRCGGGAVSCDNLSTPLPRRKSIAQMDTPDIWMSCFRGSIFTISTIKMTPSQRRVSTRICAIISQHWPGAADAFLENQRISRRFSLFSYKHTAASDFKRNVTVPDTRTPLSLFSSLTFFSCAFGHSRVGSRIYSAGKMCYTEVCLKTGGKPGLPAGQGVPAGFGQARRLLQGREPYEQPG